MAKSDDFTKWLSSNSVNGYTDCIQINVLKDSIYTIGFISAKNFPMNSDMHILVNLPTTCLR